MGLLELLVLAVGLAMDAFAVSVCKGLAIKKVTIKSILICGLWFGGFQALMPVIGYFAGVSFSKYIIKFDHWIAFALLAVIGISMIREAFSHDEEKQDDSLGFKTMLLLAIATSIDALAVGVTFVCVPVTFLNNIAGFFGNSDMAVWFGSAGRTGEIVNTLSAAGVIGVITLIIAAAGVKIGSVFGIKYKERAEIAGGIILILLGLKILIQHLVSAI